MSVEMLVGVMLRDQESLDMAQFRVGRGLRNGEFLPHLSPVLRDRAWPRVIEVCVKDWSLNWLLIWA